MTQRELARVLLLSERAVDRGSLCTWGVLGALASVSYAASGGWYVAAIWALTSAVGFVGWRRARARWREMMDLIEGEVVE